MPDRIVIANLAFRARHGVEPREKVEAQRFEIDVEVELDLGPAGRSDDLARTIDYAALAAAIRPVAEDRSFDLIEALAEAIATTVLEHDARIDAVVVRVRKPEVRLAGAVDYAGVEIRRERRT